MKDVSKHYRDPISGVGRGNTMHVFCLNFKTHQVAILDGRQIAVTVSIEVMNLSNVAASMLCCMSEIYTNRASLNVCQLRHSKNTI